MTKKLAYEIFYDADSEEFSYVLHKKETDNVIEKGGYTNIIDLLAHLVDVNDMFKKHYMIQPIDPEKAHTWGWLKEPLTDKEKTH